jgi:hypothetical protein
MKRIFCILAVVFLMCSVVWADELKVSNILEKLNLKQGIAYDVEECTIDYLSTIPVIGYKGFSLEVGLATTQKAVLVGSYQLLKLKDIIDIPILDLIEFNIGYYIGFDRLGLGAGNAKGNNEFTHGPCITLINVKW